MPSYHCPHCPWEIEGQTQVVKDIIEHERTHPENYEVYNKKVEGLGTKPACSFCGCKEEHDN